MKKKLFSAVFAIALACVLTLGIAACSHDQPTYYNRAYTLTGKAVINWTEKNRSDAYGNVDGDFSQRQIVEKYWDKIDWTKTKDALGNSVDANEIKHSTVDEFISGFKSFEDNAYKEFKDAKITVTKKDNKLELKLSVPSSVNTGEMPHEMTMPFAETQAQFDAIKPSGINVPPLSFMEGYVGMGIYKVPDTDYYIIVDFIVGRHVESVDVSISLIAANDFTQIFGQSNNGTVLSLHDASDREILDIRHRIGFTAENI